MIRKLSAELIGTALLLATVVGSGIMGETLANGNDAIALLGNTIATGAILFVLITIFGALSGAHFNPAVTLVMWLRKDMPLGDSIAYVGVQIIGGLIGVVAAHYMFDMALLQESTKLRTGPNQWFAEGVATFGLLLTIIGTVRARPEAVPMAVGLYITAGYWFTASTSFANPAVTIARSFSDTFAGINPDHVIGFILAQLAGAVIAWLVCGFMFRSD
ncbi:MAG: MIP/aquaporin family protein [Alphaproteobacteria bacterium]